MFIVGMFVVQGVITVAIVGVVIYVYFRNKKREEERSVAWRATAGQLGFAYEAESETLAADLQTLKTFRQGRGHKATNTLRGENEGIALTLTDYRYTTGSGKNSTTHRLTLCALQAESLALPHAYLRRQMKFLDLLGKMFGGQDIDFDEDTTFSQDWVLQGEDEAAVRNLFGPATRDFFTGVSEDGTYPRFQFEAGDDRLVINPGTRIEPEKAQELLGMAFQVLGVLKKG
jgi:hypothetical protein